MSRKDKKRSRHSRGDENYDNDSVLDSALNSGRSSTRSSARNSRKSSRTNSATASRSSSRVRGRRVNYAEGSDDDDVYDDDDLDDEKYHQLINIALKQSLEDLQGSPVDPLEELGVDLQDISLEDDDDDDYDDEEDNYDAEDDDDEVDDVDSEDEEDEEDEDDEEEWYDDEEEEEFNVNEEDEERVERYNLRDVLGEGSNHSYAPYARLVCDEGFVREEALDDVAVVSGQKLPVGKNALNDAIIFVAAYPCGIYKVYTGNRTTIALLNGMSRFGFNPFIFWIDAVLMSANETNAVFDFSKLGTILKKHPELRREFFLRFREGVCALHRVPDFEEQNEYVVCVLCGKDIASEAFDRWVEDAFITVANSSAEDVLYSDNNHTVFRASFDFEGTTFKLLVVRCAYHPTAHLHAHGSRKVKEAHEGTCSVVTATKHYARKTTTTTTTKKKKKKKKTIEEHLQGLNEAYVLTVKKRRERWRAFLSTDKYWLEVFVTKNSTWFQDEYAKCRNMQHEVGEVFENVKKVFKTFGTELALKFLRTNGFACRLGQVDTSTKFVEKLLFVLKNYCDENREFFEQIACNSLFAHYGDADFFKKMDEILEKYCGNDPALFAQLWCDGFFAHYGDADFFKKMDYILEKYCGKDPALLVKLSCNSLFAYYDDADFFKKMDEILEKYCGNDPALFAKLACGAFFAHMNKDGFCEALLTILVQIFNNNRKLREQFASNDLFQRIWKTGYAEKLVHAFQKSTFDPTQFAQIGGNLDFLKKLDSPSFDVAAYFSRYKEVNRWSDEDIERLKTLVKQHGGVWKELAKKHFPTRNARQLRDQWNRLKEEETTTKGSWSKKDDDELIALHKLHPNKWTKIGSMMTKPRCDKSVQSRFNLAKSPKSKAPSAALKEYAQGYENVKKKLKMWTPEEENKFIEEYKKYKNKWVEMSKKFPGRSPSDLMSKWARASRTTKKKPSPLENFALEESRKAKDIGK